MRSLFTGLFLFFCCFCFAQKHTIKFYLKDEAAQPVENAVCKFIKDSKTIESISYTDSLGFSSTEIQKGDYLLSISLFGHILYETPVEIAQDTNLGTITVKSQTLLLDAVTITAKRKSYKEHDGKLVFDVQSLPITENVTAVDALAYTPLVTLTSSGIEVAGNTGEIRVNGIKQEKGASLLSYLNAVPLSEIERIEVHQGRTADMDASIEGGYVNIVMKNPSGFTGAVQATFGFNGVEGNDRPLFSENLNVSTIYGKGGLSLFANVAIGQAEPKGLKSITTSQIEQLHQEQKQESHTSNIRRQNIDASYGLNYTKDKHVFGIEGSLYGNLNSKSQREIAIQTALKDVVTTSQVEINEVPKVFSHSLTANYFFTPQKGKNKLHWLANFITNNDETQQDYFLYQPTSSQHQEYIGNKANSTMFYTQLFDVLLRIADHKCHGQLPIHVRLWADEFYAGPKPNNTEVLMGTIRSRNMSIVPVLQSISQIKAIFPNEKWEIFLDNCATVVYLGSGPASFSTHENISKLLGEMTIDTRTDGVTTGAHGNSSRNNAKAGRGLMTPGEVRRMSRKNCILFIEGQYPIFDKKAIPFNTPRWKESEQLAGKEGYKHPVQVVYNKKTMTYKTLQPKADIQFLEKAELQFYKEAEKTDSRIKVFEMNEEDFLYLNWNKEPKLTEMEIMELAQRVKQQTKELHEGMLIVEQNKQEDNPQDWNLSGTLCECIIRYADRLSEEQLNEILLGMENGLSEEQVKTYFMLPVEKMNKYRRAYLFSM